MTPQAIVTLTPEGTLAIELPGANGSRRKVELRHGSVEQTLLEILHGQLKSRVQIGEDGAPTQAQVKHWERHEVFGDARCAFCIAEGRTFGSNRSHRVIASYDGVVIRRVEAKRRGKGQSVSSSQKSAEALGL